MNEKEKMLAGKIYDPTDEELTRLRTKAHRLSQRYNTLFEDDELRDTVIDELIPNKGKGVYLQGPVYFDYGIFTSFGENCYANFNFTVLDVCPVNIGNNVFFGPNCSLMTPMHPFRWQERNIKFKEDGTAYGDEYAKRFDNFMYGLILVDINSKTEFGSIKNVLCETALALEGRISIPQVKDKLEEIKKINTDKYWEEKDILSFEHSRRSLRDLIKFVVDNDAKSSIITNLKDVVIEEKEGATLGAAYNFEDYKKKVNRYVEDNKDALPIYKLTHNIALSKGDYEELERVLTKELGSSEDYKREYKDTPFGLLVRKIAKLEHEAAMEAFSEFINNESLNQRQIAFVNKVINHIEQNGYMEDVTDLQKPPFDKPVSVTKLFDAKTVRTLMAKIENIRENAVKTVG